MLHYLEFGMYDYELVPIFVRWESIGYIVLKVSLILLNSYKRLLYKKVCTAKCFVSAFFAILVILT